MHASIDPSTVRPLQRVEYDRLVDLGVFERERVELVRGMVVRMTPINEPHDSAVERLNELLVLALYDRARIRVQGSFAASDDSQPQPDVFVRPRDEKPGRPTRAWLIVEVADSSLRYDREVKAPLYAEAGVPEYWIVNIPERCIEVYRDPVKGQYTSKTIHARGDTVTMLKFPDVTIRVSDVIQ